MRRIIATFTALIALGMVPATAAGGAAAATVGAPGQRVTQNGPNSGDTKFFNNWSGYASLANTFTGVHGTWTQPAVTCPKKDAWSVFWIGLDGFSNGTVEQDGSSAQCINGQPHYEVWWEMFPTNFVQFVFAISPGDVIDSSVAFSTATKQYTLKVTDKTTQQSFTRRETCASNLTCERSSAEWIAESPGRAGGGLFPLADYGTLQFKASTATAAGHTGTISDPAWSDTDIVMIAGHRVRADVSGLNAKGNAFSDTWRSK